MKANHILTTILIDLIHCLLAEKPFTIHIVLEKLFLKQEE